MGEEPGKVNQTQLGSGEVSGELMYGPILGKSDIEISVEDGKQVPRPKIGLILTGPHVHEDLSCKTVVEPACLGGQSLKEMQHCFVPHCFVKYTW